MIGIVITGHGGYAIGMEDNVKMLAGESVEVQAVPFIASMSIEEYESHLKAAIESYADRPTLVFTDFAGGTPYNKAAELSVPRANVRVFGGSNSAMLMDAALRNVMDEKVTDPDVLVDEILASGHENLSCFKLFDSCNNVSEEEDGI